ncbi:PREDICTED: uncharacterized protein LOC109160759 isoform X2 [Ipomoea nil]|uniref:uncharacterized protein LOC109160759 isoform X2 n=1 Tax=Ipomoea nil TaxID=35883 RepID=UPI00090110A4|nr:PREDICTED: uncharacterized protein LOC109160759 isoform X2 [Ipomoea nil]
MRIQPIDFTSPKQPSPVKPVAKSRFKRLFEKQFPALLRTLSAEKPAGGEEPSCNKDASDEPCSVCLAKMVQNFIEESEEKHNRCYCLNRNCTDSEEDAADSCNCFGESSNNSSSSSADACEILKSLVACVVVSERNLLADTTKIIEKNKICKRKDHVCRMIIVDGLIALGYDASICQSRWEKSACIPAGDYEYIDVVIQGERLVIDIEFRSEFEIARSTKTYKSVLQALPNIFVGKCDRLQKIISIVSEAAKQSLKKKGMPVPPWRQAEYVKAKWFSPYTRIDLTSSKAETCLKVEEEESVCLCEANLKVGKPKPSSRKEDDESCSEFEVLMFGEGTSKSKSCGEDDDDKEMGVGEEARETKVNGGKKMTGLSSLIEEKA